LNTATVPSDPSATVRIDKRAAELTADGFIALGGDDFGILATDPDLRTLHAEWDELPLDEAMPAGATFRHRRFGRLGVEIDGRGASLSPLQHTTFKQDATINPMHMGRERHFAPLSQQTLRLPVLHALIATDAGIAAAAAGIRSWIVNLHFVRIIARGDEAGLPTPEGRHRDGHLYVAMHLLGRSGCTGGESRVYRGDEQVAKLTMTDVLDSLMVDDNRVSHEVTPIVPDGGRGVRDMLLVDLNAAA
jgi:hypothetical protein